jgi:hypothetical protein
MVNLSYHQPFFHLSQLMEVDIHPHTIQPAYDLLPTLKSLLIQERKTTSVEVAC